MPIDYDRLMNWRFPEVEQAYGERETILYALGIGVGADPLDENQLRFVYEKDLQALPTMATVLAYPGFWMRNPETGIDWVRIVHAEMGFVLHRPLPPAADTLGRIRVRDVFDKGADKGALVVTEREVVDRASGAPLCTLAHTTFCRGDGGFDGPRGPSTPPAAIPDRPPDAICDLPTLPQAALIYRLSGDRNPLHCDPEIARQAGFDRPILHGLCTFGVVGHALLKTLCDYRPERLRAMHARFSAPVYPGETIRTEIWRDGETIAFRARIAARDVVVLNNGWAEVTA